MILEVLRDTQTRIGRIQAEQQKDEEESNWSYAVAEARSQRIQDVIREAIDACSGSLSPPSEPAVINLTDVLKFKLSREVQGRKGKVHYCSYCGPPFHGRRWCQDAIHMTDPGRHALAIPDRDTVRGYKESDYKQV